MNCIDCSKYSTTLTTLAQEGIKQPTLSIHLTRGALTTGASACTLVFCSSQRNNRFHCWILLPRFWQFVISLRGETFFIERKQFSCLDFNMHAPSFRWPAGCRQVTMRNNYIITYKKTNNLCFEQTLITLCKWYKEHVCTNGKLNTRPFGCVPWDSISERKLYSS